MGCGVCGVRWGCGVVRGGTRGFQHPPNPGPGEPYTNPNPGVLHKSQTLSPTQTPNPEPCTNPDPCTSTPQTLDPGTLDPEPANPKFQHTPHPGPGALHKAKTRSPTRTPNPEPFTTRKPWTSKPRTLDPETLDPEPANPKLQHTPNPGPGALNPEPQT